MNRSIRIALEIAVAATMVAGVAGCAIPLETNAGGPPPSPEAVAACDTRADEEFQRQNRDAIYKTDTYTSSIRDSPFAGQGLPGTSAGLSDQYARNQGVRRCLNGVATPIQPEPSGSAAP